MKIIQFKSDNPNHQAFTEELNSRVNLYFKERRISPKGNTRLYFKAFIMIGIYLGAFGIILGFSLPIWWGIVLAIIMGIGEAGIGMSVMHDGAHGSFSDLPWVNKIATSTIVILGSNAVNWKIQHNFLHHRFTNIYDYDQDIQTKAIIRLCDHAPLKEYHRYQYIYTFFFYGLMTLSKLVGDFPQLRQFTQEGLTKDQHINSKTELIKLIVIKSIYLAVFIGLPIWLTDYFWWQVLIGFFVMHFTAGMIMSTIFQMAHVVEGAGQPLPDSDGIIHTEWTVHQLKTTSDFAQDNAFLNWYAGGLNFQVEHHLFQHISHIHFQKIAPIVRELAQKYDIPYNVKQTFSSALHSHVLRLKELGLANK
ncbi:MAG: fatty acid desaturase family protein [Flavobacteriia bacterium]